MLEREVVDDAEGNHERPVSLRSHPADRWDEHEEDLRRSLRTRKRVTHRSLAARRADHGTAADDDHDHRPLLARARRPGPPPARLSHHAAAARGLGAVALLLPPA